MPFVTANGIEMHYRMQGTGPRLLYISGSGADLRRHPNAFDSPLPNYFNVLAYDQRGQGQSETPRGPYSMADYAADANALLTELGWGRAHVIGHSFGGMVAMELAIEYPDRVDKLVLSATSSGGAGGSSYAIETLAELEPQERLSTFIALADTRRSKAWQEANPDAYHNIARETLERFGDQAPGDSEGSRLQLNARQRHNAHRRLTEILVPTLIACGKFDGIAPSKNAEAMAARIPNATLRYFQGGHLYLQDDAAAYHAIADWLNE